MWDRITEQLSKLQEQPKQQPSQANQAANLKARDQELAEVIDAEMVYQIQMSVFFQMHL